MGLVVMLEGGRASDARLRHALRPLAAFGITHGVHEWLEMFDQFGVLEFHLADPLAWKAAQLAILTFSFLSLSAFGGSLLSPTERARRLSLLVPLAQAALWAIGVLVVREYYAADAQWTVTEVWTRYVLAIPASLLASAGLIAQQRIFRQAGLIGFGQDSLWAAIAFAWYGLIGQMFTLPSPLPPSNWLNQDMFLQLFGIPIQLVRAASAVASAVFVIRFLRSFEVEVQRRIESLQSVQLEEAQRREQQRGQLLRQVVSAQEAERQRIARELHDATGQALTALGLGLRSLTLTGQGESRVRQLETLTSNTLDELRHLIADLRPSHLDDLGLASALRWYAKELNGRVPLDVQVEICGDEYPLNGSIKIALFRIAQEALNNVIKHSGADAAHLSLTFETNDVQLVVEDNGQGFDTSKPALPGRPSWGLLGMQERAALLSGQCNVQSTPGQGTRVEVVIPTRAVEEIA